MIDRGYDLEEEIERQNAVYGEFVRIGPNIFHAIACAEEELWEAKDAWRKDKKSDTMVDHNRKPLFEHTGEELLQVAAVAMRAYQAIRRGR